MINPLFLPQNAKKRKKTVNDEETIPSTTRRQFKVIHQLDCIYQGEINESYQRQGFGIQQTNDFHMYLGFWRCNKANGVGIIIYPEGGLIYGNFKENQLLGLAIVDNKIKLRIGVYENNKVIGIGYEYIYSQTKWKLSRFHKGISIQTLSQTVSPIQNGIPSMMNLHQDMCLLLSKYLTMQYFDIPVKNIVQRPYRSYTEMNVHKINNSYIYFGQVINEKYWGLGIIYDRKNSCVLQTGFYQMGQMNGYGLKIEKDKNKVQIGLYNKGKKEGFFYEKTGNLEKIVEYQKNYVKGQHPEIDLSKIKKNQTIFNYQKNDFYSQKNKIKFHQYKNLLFSNETQAAKMKNTVIGLQNPLKQKKSQGKQGKQSQKHITPKGSVKHIERKNVKFIIPDLAQKSTVQVIREKLNDIDGIIKRSRALIKEGKQKQMNLSLKSKKSKSITIQTPQVEQKKTGAIQDGQIQAEYQPISKSFRPEDIPPPSKYLRSSPRALSPRSAKKMWFRTKIQQNNTEGRRKSPRFTEKKQNFPITSSFLDFSAQKRQKSVSRRKNKKIFE